MTPKRSLLLIFLLFLPNTVYAVTKYVVKKGDSLQKLSNKFKVSVNTLKKANGLSSDRLDIGDALLVPDSNPDSPVSVNKGEYVVVKGDTLGGIGGTFGVSVGDIKKANNLKSHKLRIGQRLIIPSLSKSNGIRADVKKGEVTPARTEEKKPLEMASSPNSVSIEYTVRKGDTLGEIANSFGVSLSELRRVNGLTSDRLSVGKVLIIPASGSKGTVQKVSSKPVTTDKKYVVKKGDTLHELSKRSGVSVESIKKANGLSDNRLNIGDTLLIPDSKKEDVKMPVKPGEYKDKSVSTDQAEYSVVKGDTLDGIGGKFGVSIEDIKKANNLKSHKLRIGQTLVIPSSSNSKSIRAGVKKGEVTPARTEEKKPLETASGSNSVSIKYKVGKGDTLEEIANSFGVSLSELRRVNGLTSDRLSVGKVLIIPASGNKEAIQKASSEPVITDKRYVVKKGDSLQGLSKKFGVSVESIKRANGLRNSRLNIGDLLLIPNSKKEKEYEGRYVVAQGDTVNKIGDKFGVSVKDLKRANGIDGNTIRAGQVLTIPGRDQYRYKDETGLEKTYSVTYDNHYNENKSYDYISRDSIISVAKRFLGAPYRFGGNSPIRGLDCSAFVNKVFGFFDVDLPRTARDIYKVGQNVSKDELATGDLVFFRTYASYPSHVGIYIGDDEFIHASSKAKRVTIDSMNLPYYRRRYIGAKRIEVSGLFYDEMSKDYKGFEKQ